MKSKESTIVKEKKVYDVCRMVKDTAVANNLLSYYFKLNDNDWKNIGENLGDIVDYIADTKNIDRKDFIGIGRVIRIAYCEYSDFLAMNITYNFNMINDKEYRAVHPFVRLFPSSKKMNILNKYLRIYEAYEKTFPDR